jgi:lipopolysaccharide transport system ATP-binding protein
MAAISSLCQKAILLENGRIVEFGSVEEVVGKYLQSANEKSMVQLRDRIDRVGNQEVKFTAFEIRDALGHPIPCALSGQDISIVLHYESKVEKTIKSASVYVLVHGKFDEILFQLSSKVTGSNFENLPPRGAFICKIPKLPLQPGTYQTSLYCNVDNEDADWVPYAGKINVELGDFFGTGKLPGKDKGSYLVQNFWSAK